jgi:HSP20 family protein
MRERDVFANFARMRREVDQMLGGAWGRTTYVSRRSSGFSPNVDVYYCGEPQRAVVKVDLAGVDLDEVGIEVSGRQLAIVGERHVQEIEGRVYQQVEIPSGPFRRLVELQVDVDADRATATYEDGVLRIDLPLRDPAEGSRRVPIGREGWRARRPSKWSSRRSTPRTRSAPASRCPTRCRCCRCARPSPSPRR